MSEAARRAALALHALHPRDRRWVLQQLAPPERGVVAGLLRELQRLGIPADRPLLQEALAAGAAAAAEPQAVAAMAGPAAVASPSLSDAPPPVRPAEASVRHAIVADRSTAARVSGAGVGAGIEAAAGHRVDAARDLPLHEPAFVWAACLLDLPPAAQARQLAALPPSKARAVRALMAGGLADAVALRYAVRQALAERAPSTAGPLPVPRDSIVHRILRALRRARPARALPWARRALPAPGFWRQWVGSGGRA